MSTTKGRNLSEIKSKLERMPGKVFLIEDADLCISGLYDALVDMIDILDIHLRAHKLWLDGAQNAD